MIIPVTCKVEYNWYEAFSQLPLAKDFHRPVVGECPTETPGLVSHNSGQLLDLGLDRRNCLHGMPLNPIQRGTTVPGKSVLLTKIGHQFIGGCHEDWGAILTIVLHLVMSRPPHYGPGVPEISYLSAFSVDTNLNFRAKNSLWNWMFWSAQCGNFM